MHILSNWHAVHASLPVAGESQWVAAQTGLEADLSEQDLLQRAGAPRRALECEPTV